MGNYIVVFLLYGDLEIKLGFFFLIKKNFYRVNFIWNIVIRKIKGYIGSF